GGAEGQHQPVDFVARNAHFGGGRNAAAHAPRHALGKGAALGITRGCRGARARLQRHDDGAARVGRSRLPRRPPRAPRGQGGRAHPSGAPNAAAWGGWTEAGWKPVWRVWALWQGRATGAVWRAQRSAG